MRYLEFSKAELEIVSYKHEMPGVPDMPIYKYPVKPREAFRAAYERRPIWQITHFERAMFAPKVNPDNIARAMIYEAEGISPDKCGGKDMFGIEWEYVPQVGGSMVRPGKPFLADANEWIDKITWPDIESWDWESSAKANAHYFKEDYWNVCWFLNGWYERLISFMDFEGAVVAIIDEDQKDAVKELFSRLSDLYIRILDKYIQYYPRIDAFCIHDDWGSQKETFFSPGAVEEMIVPYMKRITDFLHSKGKYCDLHSCGQLSKQVPNMIAAGWDSWNGQLMNDTPMIYELYGDKILIGVVPEKLDPKASEEQQRLVAKEYAKKFCRPDKPSILNLYSSINLPVAFREELYQQSRINYNK